MTREIRRPTDDERQEAADVMRVSMNFGPTFVEERSKVFPIDDMRCAFEDGRLVATAGERRLTQWFGGRELAMSGIWGVATIPERRGSGLASAVVTELLRDARERGDVLTALYPATVTPYRKLGYELAGSYVTHDLPLEAIPEDARTTLDIEPLEPDRDLEGVRACYRRVAARHDGPIDSADEWWWRDRILGHWNASEIHRVVVARNADGEVEGYASYVHASAPGLMEIEFRLDHKHLIASTPDALRSLLAFFRGYRGLGRSIRFTGPPDEPIMLLVGEQRMSASWTFRWMLRPLDVPGALEGRGYPNVDGDLTFAVADELFPDDAGPWRLVADGGTVTVERTDAEPAATIDIRVLSAMYTGFVSPFDAARLGRLELDQPALAFLARLFTGRAPFMYDFF